MKVIRTENYLLAEIWDAQSGARFVFKFDNPQTQQDITTWAQKLMTANKGLSIEATLDKNDKTKAIVTKK